MSSQQTETPSNPAPVNTTLTAVFPFILGLASTHQLSTDNRENGPFPNLPEGFVIINPFINSSLVTIPSLNLESLFSQMSLKTGPLPASKASIDAMPIVEVTEENSEDCPICLSDYEVGGEAKEMPCKHRFHPGCIEKWLDMNGSCPVCRYSMPVETEEEKKLRENFDGEGEEGRRVGGITITFHFSGRSRHNQDSDLAESSEIPSTSVDGETRTSEADCN